MQELKTGSADMAFHELNRQIHLRRLEIYQANQTCESSWRERESLAPCRIWRIEKELLEKFVSELSRKCPNLKKICRTEVERIQQLRMDEFYRQESRVSQSSVNQFTVQIQELQDKVNSLNGSRDFQDLETASSSELSHVLSHLFNLSEFFRKRCRDSSPQLDTRDSCGTRRKVLENPLTPDEPTSSSSRNVSVRSLTATHCEFGSLSAGRPVVRVDDFERNTRNFARFTPRFARKFSTWNLSSRAEEGYPQNWMDMHFDKFFTFSTFQFWKTSFKIEVCSCSCYPRKQCIGSQKWRWLNQWTI